MGMPTKHKGDHRLTGWHLDTHSFNHKMNTPECLVQHHPSNCTWPALRRPAHSSHSWWFNRYHNQPFVAHGAYAISSSMTLANVSSSQLAMCSQSAEEPSPSESPKS